MQLSPKSIFSIGLIIAISATGGACYYSHVTYTEKWKTVSARVSKEVDGYIKSYHDLLASMYGLAESHYPVVKSEMLNLYTNVRREESHNIRTGDVEFYGWRSYRDPDLSFYYSYDEKLNLIFAQDPPNKTHDTNDPSKFMNIPIDGEIKITNHEMIHHNIIGKYTHDPVSDQITGLFFLSLNKLVIENQIKIIADRTSKNISVSVVWNGLRNFPFQNEIARTTHTIGTESFYVSYESTKAWKIFGEDNFAGMVTGLLGIVINILLFGHLNAVVRRSELSEHARNVAETRLNDQAKFFEDFLENLPGILFIKDARNNFKYYMFNKEAENFFGHTRAEMLGKSDMDFFNEEESNFFRSMDEAAMHERKVIDIPCEIVTVHDKEYFLHTRKVPIYDSKGDPMFLVGLSQDITKRKKIEMELTEYRENLEKIVEERTEKLKLASAKAEEASRLKSEFLATMSHEIRSPMSGVLGMAELMLDTPLSIEQKGLTRTIINSGELLLNIIEDILDFSKIEANKLELDPIPVNMLELVDEVCLLYTPRAREKALELVVRYVPGCEQFVYADPLRVRQILGNLLNNAIKFTNKGYIIITVDEDRSNTADNNIVNLSFSIEDTGIGIAPDDINHIFEKFSQANSSMTRDYGGTGLGLSICRSLLVMMGGDISVSSTLGKGSVFRFNLPVRRNKEEHFVQPKPPILKDRRILIVDDLPVIQTLLREQLTLAGMVCDTAGNGHDALAQLVDARRKGIFYDIMIIDYLMPGMNGEMLARAISDEPDFRNICLIMLTAAGNPMVGDSFAEKGFSAYISKPVKSLRLVEALSVIWEKYDGGCKNSLIRVDTSALGSSQVEEDDNRIQLQGSKILLVEDSRINQAFVEEVLSQLSCDTTTVSNGQEALDIITRKAFDLVLMDCQMPIMDGFEAARKICALKKDGTVQANLPVIALTANAMKGDRQRCIDAGMDDYITKPVRKKELKEKIYFWIKREKIDVHEDHTDYSDDNHHLESAEIVNRELLDEAKSLLKDKFEFLLGCFIEDVDNYIREMQDAIANKNIEGVVRPAHTIKSTSKRMGALKLSNVAKDIELTARDAVNNNIYDENARMMDDMRHIAAVFEETKKSLLEKF